MKLPQLSLVAGAILALSPSAAAQLTTFTQDFEGLDALDPAALGADGWLGFANVFDGAGNYQYGYGPFAAPNGGAGFSAVASGSAGAPQGLQYINVYSDYNNADQGTGSYVEANVFQEQEIDAADVGNTWTFDFDYLKSPDVVNGDGDTTTLAFIKVLKRSDGSFATLAFEQLDSTNASTTTWAAGSLAVTIDPTWAGELLQFGFASTTTAFNDSGRFYDNVSFDAPGSQPPQLSAFAENFESLDIASPSALGDAGWTAFANVFDPAGGYLYGYGTFPAPNGGPGFSAIGTGDGGAPQMSQYINIYSDYNNGDHGNGNIINALVFQEQPVGAANVGQTWRMTFDHRANPTNMNEGGTTTQAFVKVIKVSDGSFATLFENQFDSTVSSQAAWATMALDILIDPSFAGELLQFGFSSFATNFEDSGRYYDNIDFSEVDMPGLGEIICLANPGSNGLAPIMKASGSDIAADNALTLTVDNLPMNAMGFFIQSQGRLTGYNVGGSLGHVCLGGAPIGRFQAFIQDSGAAGSVSFNPDLTNIPLPTSTTAAVAGDTFNFQYWTRDMNMGSSSSNFSGALSITFN